LPNGNTLITEGTSSYIFEVSSTGTVEWDYQASGNLEMVRRYSDATPTPVPTNTPQPTFTPTPEPTFTPTPVCENTGDVNGDGSVTAGDAQLGFSIAIGSYIPTDEEFCWADCNGDESVTAGDAQLIFMTALGAGSCMDPI